MYSEQEREFKPQVIFCDNYKQSSSGITNPDHVNVAYISEECNNNKSKNSKLVNQYSNLLEGKSHTTNINCSKKEDCEFNFERYSKDNFISEYKKKDSDRVTFESLKIENLNSNISITVNYENRQENTYSRKLGKAKKDCEFLKYHLNNKFEENIYCLKANTENQSKPNLGNHLLTKDLQTCFKRTSDEIIHTHHNDDVKNYDNICENDEFNYKNIIRTSDYILSNRNVRNYCNDHNKIKINKDENQSGKNNVNKIKRNFESKRTVDSITKNECLSDNQLFCDINVEQGFKVYGHSNKKILNNLDKSNFDSNSLFPADTSSACFDSIYAKYPGISFNSQYQGKPNQNSTENSIKNSSNIKRNFQIDNKFSIISPKAISNEIKNIPTTLELSADANFYRNLTSKNEFNNPEYDLNIYSDANHSNSYLCRSSKNHFQVSGSYLNSCSNRRSNVFDIYKDCSSNCFQKEKNNECNSFFICNTQDIVNLKSDFENNIEIKPHIINKRFSNNSKNLDHIKIKQNISPLKIEYNEPIQNFIPNNISSSKSTFRNRSSKVGKNLCTEYKLDQEKYENDQLLIPSISQSTSMPNVSPYVKNSNSNNVENLKDSKIIEFYPSSFNEIISKQKTAPTVNQFEQNASQCTIQMNVEEPNQIERNTNIIKTNDAKNKKISKFIKKADTPNYRELLNKAYALKNTITENELNLEIIRRTLKCDVPQKESYITNRNNFPESKETNITKANNVKLLCSVDGENFNSEKTFNSKYILDSPILNVHNSLIKKDNYVNVESLEFVKDNGYVSRNSPIKLLNLENGESIIKTQYPIDLSVRTIKTFADSTNGQEICELQNNVNNILIPKIDFQPNFSIATIVPRQSMNGKAQTLDILDLSGQKNTVVTDKPKKIKSVQNIDVHINITSLANLKHQNNEQYSNLKNYKSDFMNFLATNSVEDNAEFLDISNVNEAIDLTSKNQTFQEFNELENMFNSKPNLKICQNSKSDYNNSCIAKRIPKKKLKYFEKFITSELELSKNSTKLPIKPNSELESRLKSDSMIRMQLKKNNRKEFENTTCLIDNIKKNHSIEEKSHQKLLPGIKGGNILTTETVLFKVENLIDDVRESKSDLDSLRIRTKAELKGFDLKGNQNYAAAIDKTFIKSNAGKEQLNTEFNKYKELNLMDWNKKCDDFLVQLSYNLDEKSCKNSEIDFISKHKKFSIRDHDIKSSKSKTLFKFPAKINNNSCCSSDEDKPLNKLCEQNNETNIILEYKQNKNFRDEILKNSDTLNIERKISDFCNLVYKNYKPTKFPKKNIYNYFEEGIEKESIKENIKTFPKLNTQCPTDNISLRALNGNFLISNKTDSTHTKTRKRKCVDNCLEYPQHNDRNFNIKTKAEMKFRQKCKDNAIINNLTESARNNCKRDQAKNHFDKNLIKKNKVQNKEKSSLIKKRTIFLKNLEFDRILRNKKMKTRENLKKTLVSSKRINNSFKNEKGSLSKKFKIIPKINQKRITRASIKHENTAVNINKKMEDKKVKSHKCESNKSNISKFPPGWENEVFEYKKSLKIPLRLINVKGSKDYNSLVPEVKQPRESKVKSVEDGKNSNSNSQVSSKSIIDILHSRAINLNKDPKRMSRRSIYSKAKSEKNYDKVSKDQSKKSSITHFSVFDTEILKARTRTESRKLKTKEYIREIFVGEDRPASAPPDMTIVQNKSDENKNSFEEKFKQYLEEINTDFGLKIRKSKVAGLNDKFNESNNKINVQYNSSKQFEKKCLNEPVSNTDKINEKEDSKEYVPGSLKIDRPCFVKMHKQKKPSKYRKKGSSGFDYIKKKKKLSTSKSNNYFVRKKIFPKFFVKKTESDVCKEIKTWVINKSLGQSYLHKAARLGYLDVIAYCLEILNMDPNPKDNAGYTPLHEACQQGRIDIARLLLRYGANHSQAAHSGIRPLHEASEAGFVEIIRLLLSYGADPLLTTYTGQTPLMLADTKEIEQFIFSHIDDIQNSMLFKKPWVLFGPWKRYDLDEIGYNELNEAPNCISNHIQIFKNFNLLSRNLKLKLMETINLNLDESDKKTNIEELVSNKLSVDDTEDQFECEESEMPLPPLYTLKNEGPDKWLLLNDLCHILKIKSKETLLKQIVSSTAPTLRTKELLRELKITDFIEKATCMQLLCAGEKLNVQASKVVLIKYNDQVKNLLGVEKTILNF